MPCGARFERSECHRLVVAGECIREYVLGNVPSDVFGRALVLGAGPVRTRSFRAARFPDAFTLALRYRAFSIFLYPRFPIIRCLSSQTHNSD